MGRHTRFMGCGYDTEKAQRWCDRLMIKLRMKQAGIDEKIDVVSEQLENKRVKEIENAELENLISKYRIEIIGEEVNAETIRKYLPELCKNKH